MLPLFENAHLLVIGDVMLDRYWHGQAGRISPEAPVPVVKVGQEEARPGGAANVAMNVAALGASVTLMGVIGEDEAGEKLGELLQAHHVQCDWVKSKTGTIEKLRILSQNQQLIRLDFEQPARLEDATQLSKRAAEKIAAFDAVILSDYAKGALDTVEEIIKSAESAGVPVFVDPKGYDFTRYQNATLIKPNQKEFEQIVGPAADLNTLVEKGQRLIEQLGLQSLLVTRSEKGMVLLEQGMAPYALKAQTQEVFDVTGAGDTVIAVLASAVAAGESLQQAARLANEAASLVVRKVGTSVVTAEELRLHLTQKQAHLGYVAPEEDALVAQVRAAQARGERVVMTNGCFDIIHAGHVRYLQEAARLGDRLIVAVNDDASVQRLKGPQRPIVPLQARMEVLAALSSVDWVVPFSEDTPERLICKVKPDVLVKGGDYHPEEIAGGKCVKAAGGEVKVLAFWDGYSTTLLVNRIREGVCKS